MIDKYLPLGSVVLLQNGKHKLMVTGYCVKEEREGGYIFDYSGCPFPEGMISLKNTALFNHEQIKEIISLGLVNNEQIAFMDTFNKFIKDNGIESGGFIPEIKKLDSDK